MVPTTDRYKFVEKIGEGGFSRVYSAIEKSTNSKVAIKILDKSKQNAHETGRKYQKEIGIMKSLCHPAIVSIYEVFEDDKMIYIVMEYIDGHNLRELINTYGGLTEASAQRYAYQIANLLHYLHNVARVIHRDLKLDNIIIDGNDNVHIVDFGLSTRIDFNHRMSHPCGSPPFIPPEMLKNYRYSTEVDIWALGVDIYAMVFGDLPFAQRGNHDLYSSIMYETPKYKSSASHNLIDLLSQMLDKEQSTRITLEGILQHPWLCQTRCNLASLMSFEDDEMKLVQNEIIEKIAQTQEERDKLIDDLKNHELNQMTTRYKIFYNQKLYRLQSEKQTCHWNSIPSYSMLTRKTAVLIMPKKPKSRMSEINKSILSPLKMNAMMVSPHMRKPMHILS